VPLANRVAQNPPFYRFVYQLGAEATTHLHRIAGFTLPAAGIRAKDQKNATRQQNLVFVLFVASLEFRNSSPQTAYKTQTFLLHFFEIVL